MGSRPRVLLWVQHLLGSGHLHRAMAIAAELARQGSVVVLVSGGRPMPWPAPSGVQLVHLPRIQARDAAFSGLLDEAGAPVGEVLWSARRARLAALLSELSPHAIVTEMYPFGRRAFATEVAVLLDFAACRGSLAISSVRDILVSQSRPDRWREMRDIALSRYTRILVHGDPSLFRFDLSFPLSPALADRLDYTGLVLAGRHPRAVAEDLGVLVSAGGGAVGHRLLATALAAHQVSRLSHRPWRLVGGSNLPDEAFAALVAAAPAGMSIDRHRNDLPDLMATADVSVSQAGYNTVTEALAGAARLVLVPFDGPGQDEQRARAEQLAKLGMAVHVEPEHLDRHILAKAIDETANGPRPDTRHLLFDGARRSATLILELIDRNGLAS